VWVKPQSLRVSHRIVDGDVPDNLKDKIVFHSDMGALIAVPNTKEI
jgi:ATP-dependent Clp protease ATP-binding subunit ClpA